MSRLHSLKFPDGGDDIAAVVAHLEETGRDMRRCVVIAGFNGDPVQQQAVNYDIR